MTEIHNEELLEQLYWEFDNERSKKSIDERMLFKGKMRYYANVFKQEKERNK